jgi:predicted RNase H-like HicB family nuclease
MSAEILASAVLELGFLPRIRPPVELRLHGAIPSATMTPMTTRDFKVFLEPDADYGGYLVVCPSIPGCYSQGKTVPEALANIREAIDLCIEDMESRGEEIPNPITS